MTLIRSRHKLQQEDRVTDMQRRNTLAETTPSDDHGDDDDGGGDHDRGYGVHGRAHT